ncbi:MAG: HD-GYP domain-containing protein [Desulfovibrio sp.]|uniref:HD-GYP domain-containing protein n=1 Tax=Desulfovibrio sp. 7SRBS1 TaxID=3378064 RepID=UPI003B3E1043
MTTSLAATCPEVPAHTCTQLGVTIHQFAESLGAAIDAKDTFTACHSGQVAEISQFIARAMGMLPAMVDDIHIAGHLHDIGKIGIPDAVLGKNSALTREEWECIKAHPVIGANILRPIKLLGGKGGIADMVLHHHERFDGKGYPDGLKEYDIPLGARVIAVADSLSAMVEDRVYRPAMSFEEAMKELRVNRGIQFDPNVVDALCRCDEAVHGWLEKGGCLCLACPA